MRGTLAYSVRVVVWCAFVQCAVLAQHFGRSWEPCVLQNDCYDDYICVKGIVLEGDDSDPYTACAIGENFNATTCFCLPLGAPKACSSTTDCSDYEACAFQTSPDDGLNCASCTALGTRPFLWKQVDDNDSTCKSLPSSSPFPTVTPSPKPSPPSRVADFCLSRDCDDGSFCHGVYNENFACHFDSVCRCGFSPYKTCEASTNCDEGTACVLDVRNNTNVCVSCTAIAQQVIFIPVDDTAEKCEMMSPVPSPPNVNFFSIRNGQTLDICRSSSTCADDRLCVQNLAELTECPSDLRLICQCIPPSSLAPCTEASECPEAEGCASIPGISGRHCYSLGQISNLGEKGAKMFGDKAWPTAEDPGFSGAPCRFDWECAEPRRCVHRSEIEVEYGGCAGRSQCLCEALVPVRCSTDDDCTSGDEVCVRIVGAQTSPTCRSAAAVAEDPLYEHVDSSDNSTVAVPGEESAGESSGLSGDTCLGDSDCVSGICRHVTEQNSTCDGRSGCFCVSSLPSCSGDSDCESGEQCVFVEDQIPFVIPAKCLSETAPDRRRIVYVSYASVMAPGPSPSSTQLSVQPSSSADMTPDVEPAESTDVMPSFEPSMIPGTVPPSEISVTTVATPSTGPAPCVDADAIAHLPVADLVYKEPLRAVVLCDANGSCATPGHVVEWHSTPMMMQSYCSAVASCSSRVLWVNSPRMRAGLRVASRTDGLRFTALAARYESRFEEMILGVLLHVGL